MAVVSLSDPDFLVDPYPAITERVRDEGVVPNTRQGGWWVLDGYELAALAPPSRPELGERSREGRPRPRPSRRCSSRRGFPCSTWTHPTAPRSGSVKDEFTPRRDRWPRTDHRRHNREALDALPRSGRIDIAAEFGDRVPMTVMSDFLGVEPDRRDEFRVWTLTRIMGMFDPKRNGTPEFVESTDQLRGYFSQRIGEAQRAPVGGLVDRLVESGELSHDEMVDLLIIMLGAGIITTADLIGNTVHTLLTSPGELDALQHRPRPRAGQRSRRPCASTRRRCRRGASSPRTPSCSRSRWRPAPGCG